MFATDFDGVFFTWVFEVAFVVAIVYVPFSRWMRWRVAAGHGWRASAATSLTDHFRPMELLPLGAILLWTNSRLQKPNLHRLERRKLFCGRNAPNFGLPGLKYSWFTKAFWFNFSGRSLREHRHTVGHWPLLFDVFYFVCSDFRDQRRSPQSVPARFE